MVPDILFFVVERMNLLMTEEMSTETVAHPILLSVYIIIFLFSSAASLKTSSREKQKSYLCKFPSCSWKFILSFCVAMVSDHGYSFHQGWRNLVRIKNALFNVCFSIRLMFIWKIISTRQNQIIFIKMLKYSGKYWKKKYEF